MSSSSQNISSVESFFDSILPRTLADKIFYGNLPKVIDDTWETIALVKCGTVFSRDAYGTGSVLVYLFAKPFVSGQKNVPALSRMEKDLNAVIEGALCDHYAIRVASAYSDYDASRNMHCSIFSIEVIIS